MAPSIATATNTESWVARRPTGRRHHHKCGLRRSAAIRALRQAQFGYDFLGCGHGDAPKALILRIGLSSMPKEVVN